MKTKIISVLAVLAIIASGLLAGCGEDVADPTQAQINTLKTKVAAIETNIGAIDLQAENDVVQWAQNQILDIKNQIAGLQSPVNYQSQINVLQADITTLEVLIAALEVQIDAIDTTVDYVPSLFVTAAEGVGTVILSVSSPVAAVVVFEITFHTTGDYAVGDPGDTINDVIKLLYTDSPTGCRAGVFTLMPEFSLSYDDGEDQWYLERITFVTQGTNIPAGDSVKIINVTENHTFGDYVTAGIRVIAQSGSTPGW